MFKEYKRLFIFDTETGGFNENNNDILELGAVLLEKEDNPDKFTKKTEISTLIKTDKVITNSNIHHITNEMCDKDGIEKQELFDILNPILSDRNTLIIAYNLPFDDRFIRAFMKRIDKDFEVKNDTLDLLEVAKARTGLWKGNKLCDMIVRYSIPEVKNSHRALDDVFATLEVMRAFFKEKNDLDNYIRKYEGE
jgi:DNA polymerase-3 subunit epsilon